MFFATVILTTLNLIVFRHDGRLSPLDERSTTNCAYPSRLVLLLLLSVNKTISLLLFHEYVLLDTQ